MRKKKLSIAVVFALFAGLFVWHEAYAAESSHIDQGETFHISMYNETGRSQSVKIKLTNIEEERESLAKIYVIPSQEGRVKTLNIPFMVEMTLITVEVEGKTQSITMPTTRELEIHIGSADHYGGPEIRAQSREPQVIKRFGYHEYKDDIWDSLGY